MKTTIVAMFLLFFVACAAPTGNTIQEDEVKVGVIVPLTGPVAVWGEHIKKSVDIAVEEINGAGGVNGKQLKIIYEDSGCTDSKRMLAAFNKVKNFDNVVAVIGPFCGTANKLAGEFSTGNDLFIISPGDNFGRVGKYMVNTRYLISEEGELLGNYVVEQGWERIAVLYFNNDWGLAYYETMKEIVESSGGMVVAGETYDYSNLDVRTQLIKIQGANPDAMLIIDGTAGELFKQAEELGISIPKVGEWEIEQADTLERAGSAVEGVVYFFPQTEVSEFHETFRQKYGEDPNAVNVDAYDATNLLKLALESCPNKDNQCMLDTVTSVSNYPGAGGPLTFDKESWSFKKNFVRKTVKNGQFVVDE